MDTSLLRTLFLLFALLSTAGAATASDCYRSECHRDEDGTLWCYNQETPCASAACNTVVTDDRAVEESSEGVNVSYSPPAPAFEIDERDWNRSCNGDPSCGVYHSLPERRAPDAYPATGGSQINDGAREDPFFDSFNSDSSRWYQMNF